MSLSDRVVIGMDPHKRSATIEVMAGDETVLGGGRFATDRSGIEVMAAYAYLHPGRVSKGGRSESWSGFGRGSPCLACSRWLQIPGCRWVGQEPRGARSRQRRRRRS